MLSLIQIFLILQTHLKLFVNKLSIIFVLTANKKELFLLGAMCGEKLMNSSIVQVNKNFTYIKTMTIWN